MACLETGKLTIGTSVSAQAACLQKGFVIRYRVPPVKRVAAHLLPQLTVRAPAYEQVQERQRVRLTPP